MFGIFEFCGITRHRSFKEVSFTSVDEAEVWVREKLAKVLVCFERDPDYDAADFFTIGGSVYHIDLIKD